MELVCHNHRSRTGVTYRLPIGLAHVYHHYPYQIPICLGYESRLRAYLRAPRLDCQHPTLLQPIQQRQVSLLGAHPQLIKRYHLRCYLRWFDQRWHQFCEGPPHKPFAHPCSHGHGPNRGVPAPVRHHGSKLPSAPPSPPTDLIWFHKGPLTAPAPEPPLG